MKAKPFFGVRDVLISSGSITKEIFIRTSDDKEIYESSPEGFTVGFKEAKNMLVDSKVISEKLVSLNINSSDQYSFDSLVKKECFGANISTPLSMAYLRYLSHISGFKNQRLFEFIAEQTNQKIKIPKIICNILNGGKHSGNNLDVCEFMIIPRGKNLFEDIRIVSEVYLDLQNILQTRLGKIHCMVGREGGFAPNISDVKFAISLIQTAIDVRNKNNCHIALDVAANNFALRQNEEFYYVLNEKRYTSKELVAYYERLLIEFPSVTYLEDPFHEEDIDAWSLLLDAIGDKATQDSHVNRNRHDVFEVFRGSTGDLLCFSQKSSDFGRHHHEIVRICEFQTCEAARGLANDRK